MKCNVRALSNSAFYTCLGLQSTLRELKLKHNLRLSVFVKANVTVNQVFSMKCRVFLQRTSTFPEDLTVSMNNIKYPSRVCEK